MTEKPETNSAIQKALSVLELVTQELRPLGIVDISRDLDLSRQTVHRVIRQLEELNLLRKDPGTERYTAGGRLRALALNTISSSNTKSLLSNGSLMTLVKTYKLSPPLNSIF